MNGDQRDDIILCIEGLEKMLSKLEFQGYQYFHHLCNENGEISNYRTFRKFFENFLIKLSKNEITSKYNTDEHAKKIWTKIDLNLNDILDKEESINVVKEIFNFVIDILKNHQKNF